MILEVRGHWKSIQIDQKSIKNGCQDDAWNQDNILEASWASWRPSWHSKRGVGDSNLRTRERADPVGRGRGGVNPSPVPLEEKGLAWKDWKAQVLGIYMP